RSARFPFVVPDSERPGAAEGFIRCARGDYYSRERTEDRTRDEIARCSTPLSPFAHPSQAMQQTHPSDDRTAPLYAAHIEDLSARFADALGHEKLDSVCIFAGPERFVARDDIAYPFRAEPYFKAWVPLVHAAGSVIEFRPGTKPRLVYFQPEDFWHAPPADP